MKHLFQSRRADATMWWIIIGAVMALIVLIILLVLFTTKSNNLSEGLSDCESKGGICATSGQCPHSTLENSAFSCSVEQVCCLGVPIKCEDSSDQTCTQKNKGSTCTQYGTKRYCN